MRVYFMDLNPRPLQWIFNNNIVLLKSQTIAYSLINNINVSQLQESNGKL